MNPAPFLLVVVAAALRTVLRSRPGPVARGSWDEPPEWRQRTDDWIEHVASTAMLLLLSAVAQSLLAVFPPLLLLSPLIWAGWVAFALPSVTREALLRAGLTRVAARLATVDRLGWRRDPRGGYCATLALGVLRDPDDRPLLARLDRALAAPELNVTAGMVLAAGIRALATGDRAEGRRLLRLVAEFDHSRRSPVAARLAVDLLAASAVDEGDLDLLIRELDHPRAPQTPLGTLLRACADRARGLPRTEQELRAAWFRSGAGATTWKLVERVLDPAARAPGSAPSAPPAEDRLEAALVATAQLFGDPPPTRSAIDGAAVRWDRVLGDPDGVPGGAPGAARVRAEVVTLLADRLASAREPAHGPPTSPVLREATWQCGARLDNELLWLSDELGTRTDHRRALPMIDEIRAWCALVDAYQRVVDVSPERASPSFAKLYYPAVRHTVWLHNDRGQATVANAMYRVELRYAEQVHHDSGVPLLQKNLRCGP